MSTWSFYDRATGALLDRTYSGPDAFLELNTPEGCNAIEGVHDHLSKRYDLVQRRLVDWQPPKPDDTELATYAWNNDDKRWHATPTLAARKLAAWGRMKAERDAAEFGGFTWNGSTFDSDAASQSRIQGAAQLAQLALDGAQPFAIDWTLADNSVRTLSAAEMISVGQALGAHIQAVHERGRLRRAAINGAATAEEAEALAWG